MTFRAPGWDEEAEAQTADAALWQGLSALALWRCNGANSREPGKDSL
ncbi:MAG: hypothetical protein AAF919_17145 [Pseudomonadota bacterium]